MLLNDNRVVKIYDISLPIQNHMLVWPGDPGVSITVKTTVKNDGVRTSWFSFGSHTATHIDAPNHFLEKATGIDKIAIDKMIGPCMVVDLTNLDHNEIMVSDLPREAIKKSGRILFKTGNFVYLHKKVFPQQYISLSLETAEYLVQRGVVLVGIDFLGIEKRKNPGHPVHKALLSRGIVLVEGLDLSNVPAGMYTLVCLPIKVVDADGAPVRAILYA